MGEPNGGSIKEFQDIKLQQKMFLPGCEIPNSAHFPHFENPEATNVAITQFLSAQTS
jgi:pimeloyl-ACP methyl ester carboxylesterase